MADAKKWQRNWHKPRTLRYKLAKMRDAGIDIPS